MPLWGCGVTVPASMKPKPKRIKGAIADAFLSNPAAKPMGLVKSWPSACVASTGSSGCRSPPAKPNRSAHNARLCAVSGSIRRSRGSMAVAILGIIAVGYAQGHGVLKRVANCGDGQAGQRRTRCGMSHTLRPAVGLRFTD